jgi:hypothetical protein
MKATITRGAVEASRKPGDKRARTEAHFWGMLRDELNESYAGEHRHVWVLWRPAKESLTSMPYGLSRGANREDMITDDDYAIRDVRELYNKGKTVRLTRRRGAGF